MYVFTVFILSLFLTIGLIPVMKCLAVRINLVDEPNQRKVHALPMPRSGGISMALGAIVPILIWVPVDHFVRAVHIGCALIVAFGMLDDMKNLKYIHKFLAQIAGALVVILYGGVRIEVLGNLVPSGFILPFSISVVLTLVFIVGITNAINLSDGLDGLAGGLCMMSFVAIGFFAYRCDNMSIAVMSLAVIGAILGFLRYNTHPAVVFMGDAGSQMLGFLCAVFVIVLTQSNTPYSQVMPLFLIGLPILDTLTVMTERILKGVSPFRPDKNHFHHKLMRLGLYHSESVLFIYVLQTLFICCGFMLRFYSNWFNLIVFVFLAGSIISVFEIANIKGFRFRTDSKELLGTRSVLAVLVGERFSIKVFFFLLKWGLALVFFVQCVIPSSMPTYMSFGAIVFIALIWGVKIFKPEIKKRALRISLYCTIPPVLYFSTITPSSWVSGQMLMMNNAAFICLVFLVIVTLNLTRRKKGFKVNPLDFLVVIVIIVFPHLPGFYLEASLMRFAIPKVLILFFSYDVVLGEFRRESSFIDMSVTVSLVVIASKGFL